MLSGIRMTAASAVAGAVLVAGTMMAGAGSSVGGGTAETASSVGPPIICHPFEIGDCPTLPWSNEALKPKRGYNKKNLVNQTVGFLDKQDAAVERMETIRRAAIYVDGDKELGLELLSRLSWRAMDAQAVGKPDAGAWFDAAFLVACFDEVGPKVIGKAGISDRVPAYAWMKHAIALDASDGDIDAGLQLGAALMVHPMMHESRDGPYALHLAAALDAAQRGSLESVNINAEIRRWDETPASIRRAAERQYAKRGG